jgi:hypothetical protein
VACLVVFHLACQLSADPNCGVKLTFSPYCPIRVLRQNRCLPLPRYRSGGKSAS